MSYLALLRRPDIAALLVFTLAARLPVGINSLAVLLYVEAQRDSFATAGLVTGGLAVGTAIGGPLQGRLVDRHGLRPLVPVAVLHVVWLATLWALVRAGIPVSLLAAAGFLCGASLPPATSILRSRWPFLLHDAPSLIPTAYALDSVLIQAVFVTGPLLTAATIALVDAEAALLLSGTFALVGITYTTLLLQRHSGPAPSSSKPRFGLGALASAPLRTLVLASIPVGFYLGSIEVALPAYAEGVGRPALAGVLLSAFSLAGVGAGLAYGVHRFDVPLHVVHMRMTWLLPIAGLPLLAASSDPVVGLLVLVAGTPVAPLVASRNQLVASIGLEGTVTEAFTWPLTAMIAGISAGVAAGGLLADHEGWTAPIGVGAALAALGALFLRLNAGSLVSGLRSAGAVGRSVQEGLDR